jgi:hypothetical protein
MQSKLFGYNKILVQKSFWSYLNQFLMIQRLKIKYICVEIRSHMRWDERPVETSLN